jgi:hypothetical protein
VDHGGLDINGTTVVLFTRRTTVVHLGFKTMDESSSDISFVAPPLMPWREFADWIRMGNDHNTVWGWIRNGYLPSHKVGKHVMVNVALLTQQLLEKEWIA